MKPYHQLSPFNASVDQFPDAYVIDRGSELPLRTFEVHSGYQYDGSVTKTITGNYVHGRTGEAVKNKYFYLGHEIKIRFKQSNHQEPVSVWSRGQQHQNLMTSVLAVTTWHLRE